VTVTLTPVEKVTVTVFALKSVAKTQVWHNGDIKIIIIIIRPITKLSPKGNGNFYTRSEKEGAHLAKINRPPKSGSNTKTRPLSSLPRPKSSIKSVYTLRIREYVIPNL